MDKDGEHWRNEAERISKEAIGVCLRNIQLEKMMDIALDALKQYSETETYDWIDSKVVARRAMLKIKEVMDGGVGNA